jgi:hypothetical protein
MLVGLQANIIASFREQWQKVKAINAKVSSINC